MLADFVPKYDATVVRRLKEAGAIILGKLNLCEGAMSAYSRKFPLPLNPWSADAWAGASSSGSGIAAAAGLAYATIGTDTGGSIRYPAASCGVVGLKPTWGKVSRYGVFPLAESLDHVGPIARRTADCAMVLDAIAGHDPKDPTSLPSHSPVAPHLEEGVKGLQLGWDENFASYGVDTQLFKALAAAVDQLARLGARIEKVRVPELRPYGKAWVTLCSVEAVVAHSDYYPQRRDEYGPGFRQWLDFGSKASATEYARAVHQRNECVGKLAKLFENIDVLICPADTGQAFKITPEQQYGEYPQSVFDGDWARFTAVFDFNGAPTLTLPCGFDQTGLPLALQLVGKHGREDVLCRLGHAFEGATEFHKRHPTVG